VSAQHVFFLAKSEWLDPWSTNVLIACPFELDEDRLKNAGRELSKFTVLDNATSLRLSIDLGIDLVPYQVSLDKDGKVNRLGNAVE
jgi:hypothetical protein